MVGPCLLREGRVCVCVCVCAFRADVLFELVGVGLDIYIDDDQQCAY